MMGERGPPETSELKQARESTPTSEPEGTKDAERAKVRLRRVIKRGTDHHEEIDDISWSFIAVLVGLMAGTVAGLVYSIWIAPMMHH
jgi:hypothetical protein